MAAASGGHVILGVTGSIAAHRALDITSELRKRGHRVSVVMTAAAQKLITPLAFQAMALSKVYTDLWERTESSDHDHIRLAEDGHVLCIAPATADVIGRLAHGLLDDVLLTTAFAFRGPRIVAPAMNWRLFENPILKANLARLREAGFEIVDPDTGDLACGERGPGRLAPVPSIVDAILAHLPPSP